MTTLTERVEQLEAMEAARRLLARYARACDGQDLEGVVSLFHDEAEVEVPGRTWKGQDGVRECYRAAWEADPSRKSHFITNVECTGYEAGRVSVEASFLYTAAGVNSSVLGWGQYRDEVNTSGPDIVFTRKWMNVSRAGDIRQGWSL